MRLAKMLTLGGLGLGALTPVAAFADRDGDDRDHRDRHEERRDDRRDDHRDGRRDEDSAPVWISGHVEARESRSVIPAVVRQEWVPDRVEEVCIPAVTERICIPAVTERVCRPAVVRRVWVPELRESTFIPGHYEVRRDDRGCECRVWIDAHYEVRIVRAGRFEDRVVREACEETRIVEPERVEIRVVTPERREVRVVQRGYFASVVVCPERCEVTVERVWVPGHWESRSDRPRC
jgi:hypothetical protein